MQILPDFMAEENPFIRQEYWLIQQVLLFRLFLFVCLFCLLRASPEEYGGSQATAPNGAAATTLRHSHSNGGLSCIWYLHRSSWQCQILNPLSEARGGTCVLMDASRIRFHWATTGTLYSRFLRQDYGSLPPHPAPLPLEESQENNRVKNTEDSGNIEPRRGSAGGRKEAVLWQSRSSRKVDPEPNPSRKKKENHLFVGSEPCGQQTAALCDYACG